MIVSESVDSFDLELSNVESSSVISDIDHDESEYYTQKVKIDCNNDNRQDI